MNDVQYKQLPYHAIKLLPCGFCMAGAEMWQLTDERSVRFVVMCCLTDDQSPLGDDCPLVMPPNTFYAATKREAAQYWNAWGQFCSSRRLESTAQPRTSVDADLVLSWALQIEAAYSHLPSSEFPGPPTDLVRRMRHAAGSTLTNEGVRA